MVEENPGLGIFQILNYANVSQKVKVTYLIRVFASILLLEFTEISKKVGIAWNNLSEQDKEVRNLIILIIGAVHSNFTCSRYTCPATSP